MRPQRSQTRERPSAARRSGGRTAQRGQASRARKSGSISLSEPLAGFSEPPCGEEDGDGEGEDLRRDIRRARRGSLPCESRSVRRAENSGISKSLPRRGATARACPVSDRCGEKKREISVLPLPQWGGRDRNGTLTGSKSSRWACLP